MKTIDDDTLAILSGLDIKGKEVRILSMLERKAYTKVNEALESCGGKWNKKLKAHVFADDAGPLLDSLIDLGSFLTPRDTGFFPTPESLARALVEMAEVGPGDLVLEPSAGTGRIVEALIQKGCITIVVERDVKMRQALRSSNCGPVASQLVHDVDDFLDFQTGAYQIEKFDAVVMNPPFCKVGKGDHLDHVRHAVTLTKPGGFVVSVLPSSIEFRQDKRYTEFREFLKGRRATVKRLPEGSFAESGTGVNAVTVKIPVGFPELVIG